MNLPAEYAGRGYDELPIPFGWFAVAMTDEIAAGDVKSLDYFDTELVVWRSEAGRLHAVDPYCPHLGAHLGHGGSVVGETLRCPFHNWSFNGDGGVADIPYTKLVPPKLKRECLKIWPIDEKLGVIYVWYHPRKAPPKWELASPPDLDLDDWVEASRHDWVINVHVQELTENGQDFAHFPAVHGTRGPPASEFKLDGWSRRTVVETEMVTPRGPMQGKIDIAAVGPGQSFVQYTDVTRVLHLQQATPITAESSQLRWQMFVPSDLSEGRKRVTSARIRDLVKQVEQDIPIWEHKRYRATPLLVEGDGPILAYRQAYTRFYAFDDAAGSVG